MFKSLLLLIISVALLFSCDEDEKSQAGCIDPDACNYNAEASIDDGSCTYALVWYSDPDQDGKGSPGDSLVACTQPEGYVDNNEADVLPEGPSSERHTKWIKGTKYDDQGFWEYLPAGYGDGRKWPLIVFLHGIGENGNGNEAELNKVLNNGPPKLIKNSQWPVSSSAGDAFIVLSVQNSTGGCHEPTDIKKFTRWAADEYDVDISQIYITGLSCGAIGLWTYVNVYLNDDLIAAIVPIAGDGKAAWFNHGCDLAALPVWAFHGDSDPTVSVAGTNTPLDGLVSCDPAPVDARKTIYPEVGHNSWTQTYDLSAGHDIYTWMLSHTNPDAEL